MSNTIVVPDMTMSLAIPYNTQFNIDYNWCELAVSDTLYTHSCSEIPARIYTWLSSAIAKNIIWKWLRMYRHLFSFFMQLICSAFSEQAAKYVS